MKAEELAAAVRRWRLIIEQAIPALRQIVALGRDTPNPATAEQMASVARAALAAIQKAGR